MEIIILLNKFRTTHDLWLPVDIQLYNCLHHLLQKPYRYNYITSYQEPQELLIDTFADNDMVHLLFHNQCGGGDYRSTN